MAIITNLQPPAGTPVAADAVLAFDVIDPLISELRVFVWAVFKSTGQVELIYDSEFFQPLYSFSLITPAPGGRTFSVQRVGGWPSQPELRVDTCACPPTIGAPSSGEVNTASNVGGGAGSVFRTKVAEDLEFRTLRSSDSSVSITTEAQTIDITVPSPPSGLTEPVLDPSNAPVPNAGPPATNDLTLVLGGAGVYFEPGGPQPELRVFFPAITASDFGRRVGVFFNNGTTNTQVAWTPDAADAFVDPKLAFSVPGAPVVVSPGEYGPDYFVFEAVENLAGPGVHGWAPNYNLIKAAAAPQWSAVLGAGNRSGANNALVELQQRVEWGHDIAADPGDPFGHRTARRLDIPAPGAGVWSNMGDSVAEHVGGDNTRVIVRAQCTMRQGGVGDETEWAIIEQVWSLNAVSSTVLSTTLKDNSALDVFRFNASGGDLHLQVQDTGEGGDIVAYAMIDVVVQQGPPTA